MTELSLDLAGEYLVMAATLAEIKSRMLLPRAADPMAGLEEDPRAELVRRLQEYERFKQAAQRIDALPRLERDHFPAVAQFSDRRIARVLPEVTLQEMLIAFRDVAMRAEMFAHHHIQREPLSVRARMSDILAALRPDEFTDFAQLFLPEEGRMGVTVTFVAILELLREGLIDIVQREAYAPLYVRAAPPPLPESLVESAEQQNAEAEDARLLEAPQPPEDEEDGVQDEQGPHGSDERGAER
jgi:segregation and condensation protein A